MSDCPGIAAHVPPRVDAILFWPTKQELRQTHAATWKLSWHG